MSVKCSILCVDDEESVLKALKRRLMLEGYNVLAVLSPLEGLSILDREPVDMVISDQRMPEMNGFEFLREVRKRHPSVVRILVSGYSDFDNLCKAVNDGDVFRFIAKPWNSNELVSLVRESLGHQRTSHAVDEIVSSICRKVRDCAHVKPVWQPERKTVSLKLENNENKISEESAACLVSTLSELLGRHGEAIFNGADDSAPGFVVVSVDLGAGVILKIEVPLAGMVRP